MEVLQRTANRGSISTGYDIENSLKVERTNTEYLKRVVSSAGNAKVWCASMWIKRTELDGSQQFWQFLSSMTSDGSGGYSGWPTRIGFFYSADQLWVDSRAGSGNKRLTSLQRLRDTSAWYHIVVMQDTTQSTDTNRTKIYINGTLLLPADLDYDQYPAQNDDTAMNVANSQIVVGAQGDGSYPWSGYIADVHFLDGQSGKTASDFAEYDEDSGIWKPKAYTGAYGTNGFHLKFEDSSNMGLDSSGNGNNLTSNNITAADQATDTPTNNFCTLASPQQFVPSKTASLVKEGGTTMFGGNVQGAYSTMGVRSGKWYFESTITNSGGVGTENHGFGVIAANRLYDMNINGEDIGADVGGWACAGNANPRNNNAGASGANYLTSPAVDVVLGCAIDMDNGKIWWHNAGTWHSLNNTVGNPATGASPAWSNLLTATDDFVLPAAGLYQTGAGIRAMNFGGYALPVFTAVGTYSDSNGHGSFSYAPPTGYYALCTKNLAEFG